MEAVRVSGSAARNRPRPVGRSAPPRPPPQRVTVSEIAASRAEAVEGSDAAVGVTRTRTVWVPATAGLTDATAVALTELPVKEQKISFGEFVGGALNSAPEPAGSTRMATRAAAGFSSFAPTEQVALKVMTTRWLACVVANVSVVPPAAVPLRSTKPATPFLKNSSWLA